MQPTPKRFLGICAISVATLGLLVVAFNVLVDPYLLFDRPRILGFNAKKPGIEDQLYLIKAYDVSRSHPRTLLIGSSGIAVGLSARSAAWPNDLRPVYNLGILGGSTSSAYRYLQHALTQSDIRLVVMGVEFRDLLAYSRQHEPQYEPRLTVNLDGSRNSSSNRQRLYDLLFSSLSFNASIDSTLTMMGNVAGDSSDIESGDVDFKLFRSLNARFGPYPNMTYSDISYSYLYRDGYVSSQPLIDVGKVLQLCREKKIKLIILIDPAHADELELTYMSEKWGALEEWKRKLTALVASFATQDERYAPQLWDFYEFDTYSSESLWTNRSYMKWFLTPTHYTPDLGDQLISRIFGSGDPQLGTQLTPQNIENHLAEIRRQRVSYQNRQPRDLGRAYDIYTQVDPAAIERLTPKITSTMPADASAK